MNEQGRAVPSSGGILSLLTLGTGAQRAAVGGSEQAESQKQMGGCETLINDLNGCSLQKASH